MFWATAKPSVFNKLLGWLYGVDLWSPGSAAIDVGDGGCATIESGQLLKQAKACGQDDCSTIVGEQSKVCEWVWSYPSLINSLLLIWPLFSQPSSQPAQSKDRDCTQTIRLLWLGLNPRRWLHSFGLEEKGKLDACSNERMNGLDWASLFLWLTRTFPPRRRRHVEVCHCFVDQLVGWIQSSLARLVQFKLKLLINHFPCSNPRAHETFSRSLQCHNCRLVKLKSSCSSRSRSSSSLHAIFSPTWTGAESFLPEGLCLFNHDDLVSFSLFSLYVAVNWNLAEWESHWVQLSTRHWITVITSAESKYWIGLFALFLGSHTCRVLLWVFSSLEVFSRECRFNQCSSSLGRALSEWFEQAKFAVFCVGESR